MRVLLKDLIPGEKYALQLRANTGSQVSDWSSTFRFTTTTDLVAPAAVTNLTWNVVGSSFVATWERPQFNINGTPITDFKDYEVVITAGDESVAFYVTEETFVFDIAKNRAAFEEVKANLTITVKARDTNFNVIAVGTTVNHGDPAPTAPSNLIAVAAVNAINLSWSPVDATDIKAYRVYAGTSAESQPTKVWEGLASAFVYASIEFGTTFYFKVSAVDYFDQESSTVTSGVSPLSFDPNDATPPADPVWSTDWFTSETDLSDRYVRKVNVTLKWQPNAEPDIKRYIVKYRQGGVGPYTQSEISGTYLTAPTTTLKILGLPANVTYEFLLAAADKTGNASNFVAAPAQGTTGRDTTGPSTPEAPTARNYIGGLVVGWSGKSATGANMSSDLSHVDVHMSTTATFTPSADTLRTRMNESANRAQEVFVGGLIYETTYYVKLVAVDFSNNSSPASTATAGVPKRVATGDIGPNTIVAGSGIIGDLAVDSAMIANLNAGKITTGELAANQRIIAGDMNGAHAEMTDTGFRVFKEDPVDNVPDEVARLGVAGSNDFFAVTRSDGTTAASIDSNGRVIADSLHVTNDIYIASDPINGYLSDYIRTIGGRPVGWAAADLYAGNWYTTNTEMGYLSLSVEIPSSNTGARTQMIIIEGVEISAEAGDTAVMNMRRGTPGRSRTLATPVTVASESIRRKVVYPVRLGWSQQTSWVIYHNQTAHPLYTTYVNYLLTYGVGAPGSSGISVYRGTANHVAVLDFGPTSITMSGGLDAAGGGAVTPPPPPPPVVRQQYVGEWISTGGQTYKGNGALRTDTTDVIQGYQGSNGNMYGMFYFPSDMQSVLGSAYSIDHVEVYMNANHWYNNAGGTALIGFHNGGPGARTGPLVAVGGWPKPGGRWVDVSGVGNIQAWNGAGYKGITVGPAPNNSTEYYGRFDWNSCHIKVWYTK